MRQKDLSGSHAVFEVALLIFVFLFLIDFRIYIIIGAMFVYGCILGCRYEQLLAITRAQLENSFGQFVGNCVKLDSNTCD